MPERISKILSARGIASRRESERLIREGRVCVNGVAAEIGQSADAEYDEITVDGAPLSSRASPVYIMLNKPRGFITTVSDDRGRKTVMDLVSDVETRVYPVGRLDMASEGLLLMTNDGEFANVVAHPSRGKIKTYEVKVRGDAVGAVQFLCQPVLIDSRMVWANSVELIKKTAGGGILSVSIYEGRNRQIRKMCDVFELKVLSLRRVSIGTLKLGSLALGQWRHLTEAERRSLCGN
ncbi:MAG: rRNA pseudouridine synthase [Oscillospiraceae bacterium]|nr:rRNA pseudouridine synthase [Oscillospiraceae bacterium]